MKQNLVSNFYPGRGIFTSYLHVTERLFFPPDSVNASPHILHICVIDLPTVSSLLCSISVEHVLESE